MSKNPTFKATAAAPIFPTSDLPKAVQRYRRMGFAVHVYPDGAALGDAIYAFACYGPGELHLQRVNCTFPPGNTSAAYFWVEDADSTHAAWAAADLEGRPRRAEGHAVRGFASSATSTRTGMRFGLDRRSTET